MNSSSAPNLKLTAPINRILLAASALAAFTTLLHIVGGGASVADPIAASSLADEPRLLALVVWHMASVVLGFSAIALAIAAMPHHAIASRYLVLFVSALWIAFGFCAIGVALTQAGDHLLLKLPQPLLLLPVGILGFWGSRSAKR